MRYFLAIVFLIAGAIFSQVYGQFKDRLVPHSGVMYEILAFEDALGSGQTFNRGYYTFNLGSYVAMKHANDVASVGFDASLNFGINFPNTIQRGTVVTFIAQTPVFLMGRLGAGATTYNQQGFGIGAGIGGNYTYFADISDINTGSRIKSGFLLPAAMAEVTLRSRGSALTVRGHMALSTVNSTVSGDNRPDISYKMGNWGIGLISSF